MSESVAAALKPWLQSRTRHRMMSFSIVSSELLLVFVIWTEV